MIKIGALDVWGFEHAIRGCRNALESWEKIDSFVCPKNAICESCDKDFPRCGGLYLGENDLTLMRRLYKAGTEQRKYLRQIFVSMDITAPLYFWKEADTYKVGTTTNSCSTMHCIHKKEFSLDDFSHEHLTTKNLDTYMLPLIKGLNEARDAYLDSKEKNDWWQMIQMLPSSYNQMRTWTMNYENVVSIIHQRFNHKLDEWRQFTKFLGGLPYVKEIMS